MQLIGVGKTVDEVKCLLEDLLNQDVCNLDTLAINNAPIWIS